MSEEEKNATGGVIKGLDIRPVVVDQPKLNILLYGPAGAGKTVLAATAQDHKAMGDVLFGNFEGGLLSLGSRPGIGQIRITSIDQLEELFWAIANRDPSVKKYRTLVIDSGSELQTLDLEQIATKAYNDPGKRGKRQSQDELYQEDYGKSTTKLRRLFRWFRDAPINVIITALPKKVFKKNPGTGEPELVEVVPAFTDKLGGSVMGYVDFVWYLFVDESGKRRMLTQDTGKFRAKTRGVEFAKALGPVVDDPNIAKLYDILIQTEGKKQ